MGGEFSGGLRLLQGIIIMSRLVLVSHVIIWQVEVNSHEIICTFELDKL